MADIVSAQTRSRMMSGIRGKNTKPEVLLRKMLFRAGFRFRLHRKDLPGKPDLVLTKWNSAIFVNGCFWHRHEGCRLASTPSTRPEFWQKKFAGNVQRDTRNQQDLLAAGWRVAIVWECGLRQDAEKTASDVVDWLKSPDEQYTQFPASASTGYPR